MISSKHIKTAAQFYEIYKLKFSSKTLSSSLTSHLHVRTQPYVYNNGWNV